MDAIHVRRAESVIKNGAEVNNEDLRNVVNIKDTRMGCIVVLEIEAETRQGAHVITNCRRGTKYPTTMYSTIQPLIQ